MSTTDAEIASPTQPRPDAFLSGRPNDQVRDLLAFAMAAQAGASDDAKSVAAYRAEADKRLVEHAVIVLHNRVQEIRNDAVASALSEVKRSAGFWDVFAAAALAVILVGGAVAWLATRTTVLSRLSGG